jgi:hypothetical protein
VGLAEVACDDDFAARTTLQSTARFEDASETWSRLDAAPWKVKSATTRVSSDASEAASPLRQQSGKRVSALDFFCGIGRVPDWPRAAG